MTNFRDSLKTETAKYLYDWGPFKKSKISYETLEEIVRAFSVREDVKVAQILGEDPNNTIVELDCDRTIHLYTKWRRSFYEHGYQPPILIFSGDCE